MSSLEQTKAIIQKRFEFLKDRLGYEIKISDLYEAHAHELGDENWAACKAQLKYADAYEASPNHDLEKNVHKVQKCLASLSDIFEKDDIYTWLSMCYIEENEDTIKELYQAIDVVVDLSKELNERENLALEGEPETPEKLNKDDAVSLSPSKEEPSPRRYECLEFPTTDVSGVWEY